MSTPPPPKNDKYRESPDRPGYTVIPSHRHSAPGAPDESGLQAGDFDPLSPQPQLIIEDGVAKRIWDPRKDIEERKKQAAQQKVAEPAKKQTPPPPPVQQENIMPDDFETDSEPVVKISGDLQALTAKKRPLPVVSELPVQKLTNVDPPRAKAIFHIGGLRITQYFTEIQVNISDKLVILVRDTQYVQNDVEFDKVEQQIVMSLPEKNILFSCVFGHQFTLLKRYEVTLLIVDSAAEVE